MRSMAWVWGGEEKYVRGKAKNPWEGRVLPYSSLPGKSKGGGEFWEVMNMGHGGRSDRGPSPSKI